MTSWSVPVHAGGRSRSSASRPPRGAALFLGGRFAVPVGSLPANVRFAGSAGGTEVLIGWGSAVALTEHGNVTSPSVSATTSPEASSLADPEPLVYVGATA